MFRHTGTAHRVFSVPAAMHTMPICPSTSMYVFAHVYTHVCTQGVYSNSLYQLDYTSGEWTKLAVPLKALKRRHLKTRWLKLQGDTWRCIIAGLPSKGPNPSGWAIQRCRPLNREPLGQMASHNIASSFRKRRCQKKAPSQQCGCQKITQTGSQIAATPDGDARFF